MNSMFISPDNKMPGNGQKCLFKLNRTVILKDEYRCSPTGDCIPELFLYAVEDIVYSVYEKDFKIGDLENCIFIRWRFEKFCSACSNKKYSEAWKAHNFVNVSSMKDILPMLKEESLTWGFSDIEGWIELENSEVVPVSVG